MARRSRIKELEAEVERLTAEYEKKIFDLKQLIEISKSLNSSLEFNSLIQSVLYICMGQLRVLKAGLFVRTDISRQHLTLNRNQVGFEIDHSVSYIIPEDHRLLQYLGDHFRCHTMDELIEAIPEVADLRALTSLDLCLVIPLRSKNVVNGIIVLGDPISAGGFSDEDMDYALTIATLSGVAVYNAWLYEITTTDMMTRLRLRHFFLDNLGSAIGESRRKKRKLFLLMLDIDNFKRLNDTYGHVAGDLVIKQVAEIMLTSIRQTDLAARYGGEEFVILISEGGLATAKAIAERIRLSIEEASIPYDGVQLSVTISIGIAEFESRVDHSPRSFIERADRALYQSKTAGKNRVTVADPPGLSSPS